MNLNKLLYSGVVLSVLGVSSANILTSNKDITAQAKTHSNKIVKHYFYGKNVRAYGHHGVIYKNYKMTNKIGKLSQAKFKNKKFKVDEAVKVRLSNGHYVTLVKIKGHSVTGFVKVSNLHIYSLKSHSSKKTSGSSASNTTNSSASSQSSTSSQSSASAQSSSTSSQSSISAQSSSTSIQSSASAQSSSTSIQSSASAQSSSSASKQSSASAQSSNASKQSSASAQSSSASSQSSASAQSSSASKQSSASAQSSSSSSQSSAQSTTSNSNSNVASSSSDPKLDAARAQIFTDLNADRASVGVAPVTRNAKLDQLAQLRAQQLISNFSHYNASGQLYAQIDAPQFGLPSDFLCAENIAMNEEDDNIAAAKMSNTQWWTDEKGSTPDNDGGHRKNIRDAGNNYVGIGAAYDSKTGNWYFVQDFGSNNQFSSEYVN